MNRLLKCVLTLAATGMINSSLCFAGTADKVVESFTPKMATISEDANIEFVKNRPAFGDVETAILREKDIETTYTFEVTEPGKYYFNAVVRTGTSLKSENNIAGTYQFLIKGKRYETTFVKTIKNTKYEDKNYAVTVGQIQSGNCFLSKGKHSVKIVNKVANASLSTVTLMKRSN